MMALPSGDVCISRCNAWQRVAHACTGATPRRPPSPAPCRSTAVADPFTGRLLAMYRTVLAEGVRQPVALGVFRSDYMIDEGGDGESAGAAPRLRQIELNTISSAFAGLSPRVTELHAYLTERYPAEIAAVAEARGGAGAAATAAALHCAAGGGADGSTGLELPPNDATIGVAAALAAAVNAYVAGTPRGSEPVASPSRQTDPSATAGARVVAPVVVAFVVQPRERNVMDQRLLEYALWAGHRVRAVRVTLAELRANGALRQSDGALTLRRGTGGAEVDEVAVVYYRCGYTPDDYPTETGAACAAPCTNVTGGAILGVGAGNRSPEPPTHTPPHTCRVGGATAGGA